MNSERKPILVLRRLKNTKSKTHIIYWYSWFVLMSFLSLYGIFANELRLGAIFLILLALFFYLYFFSILEIICYDDYLIIKCLFWQSILYYSDIKQYLYFDRPPLIKSFIINSKKYKFLFLVKSFQISYYLFDEYEINKFENILKSKNISEFKPFGRY